VNRINQRQKSKAELRALTTLVRSVQNETKNRAAITFFPGITNKLQGIFKRNNIDLVYSNRGKLSDVLRNPKDKFHPLEKSGVLSTKLHIKVVKRNTSARQKNVPSQDLRSMSGT
jgi:hypothetical protein